MKFKPLNRSVSRKELIDAIIAKNARSLKWKRKEVGKLVNSISPLYRELVYRIISDSSVTFRHSYTEGATSVEVFSGARPWAKKAVKMFKAELAPTPFCHEIGHCVDLFYGMNWSLSENVPVEDGRSLREMFDDEFLKNKDKIYACVLGAFWDLVEKEFGKEKKETLSHYMPVYELLRRGPSEKVNEEVWLFGRWNVHRVLDIVGFTPLYCDLMESKIPSEINALFEPISDALSSVFPLPSVGLFQHKSGYYEKDESLPASEFFANLFAIELTSDQSKESFLKKLLPQSFGAFQKLFNIILLHFLSGEALPAPLTRQATSSIVARERWQDAAESSSFYASTFADDGWQMPEDIKERLEFTNGFFKDADKIDYVKPWRDVLPAA